MAIEHKNTIKLIGFIKLSGGICSYSLSAVVRFYRRTYACLKVRRSACARDARHRLRQEWARVRVRVACGTCRAAAWPQRRRPRCHETAAAPRSAHAPPAATAAPAATART